MTALAVILGVLLALALVVIVVLGRRVAAGTASPSRERVPTDSAGVDGAVHFSDADPARLVAALDALNLGVVVADPDEVLGFQNRAAQVLLASHDARAIVNRAVRELLVSAVRGDPGEREVDLFGPPKASYLIRAVPLDGGGSVAVIEDVTERRRTDQVRRDFVSNISHELKTPVGAVGLLAETMGDETDPATIRRFSERINVEVARLSRTIDDLLELSRIEFADDLHIEHTAVAAIVDEVVARFRVTTDARHIDLRTDVAPDLVLAGDRRQITSALSNLVDNAVKYSPDGAAVDVTAAGTSDGIAITVTDHGDGIPTRDLDRVFERFYRVDRARSRETGGTGLGLAIVRHVAHNHGGDVSVRSREGAGATFTLLFPPDRAQHADVNVPRPEVPA